MSLLRRYLVVTPTATRYREWCAERGLKEGREALYCSNVEFMKGRGPSKFIIVWDQSDWFHAVKKETWVELNKQAIRQGFDHSSLYERLYGGSSK